MGYIHRFNNTDNQGTFSTETHLQAKAIFTDCFLFYTEKMDYQIKKSASLLDFADQTAPVVLES
jgi:hypothetical protein